MKLTVTEVVRPLRERDRRADAPALGEPRQALEFWSAASVPQSALDAPHTKLTSSPAATKMVGGSDGMAVGVDDGIAVGL